MRPHRLVAVHLRHHHVHQHDVDRRPCFFSISMPSLPFSAYEHLHLVALEHARQREDVAHVVVDDQHLLARRAPDRRCAAARASAASARAGRLDPVEEQRRLVEQPLGRLHVLDDDRLGVRAAARSPLLGQLLAGVDDDRKLRQRRARRASARAARSRSCPRRPEVEHHAVERLCSSAASASSPVATAVVSTSSLPISSTMLLRSSRRPRRPAGSSPSRSMKPLMRRRTRRRALSCSTGLPR